MQKMCTCEMISCGRAVLGAETDPASFFLLLFSDSPVCALRLCSFLCILIASYMIPLLCLAVPCSMLTYRHVHSLKMTLAVL